MSGRKEKVGYQLQKLHREKLEQELEGIRKEISDYYKNQEKGSIKRRRENIYVLFAIAIIGGFFTIIPRTAFTINSTFLIGFGVFALASLLFLIIKINTVALTETSTENTNIDTYSEYLFAFSINGILFLAGVVAFINILNVKLNAVASTAPFVIVPMILSLLITVLKYTTDMRRRKQRRKKWKKHSEMIREEMLEEMTSNLEDLRGVNNRKEELEIFHDLTDGIEHAKDEFVEAESLKPVAEELENLEEVSDSITEILQERFEETQEALRGEKVEEESLEERREQLQEEYKELMSKREA